MLQKHVEIYWKCLVQFLIGHAEDDTKNLIQVISIFLISHVLGDHLWSMTMLLRQCWSKILFWQHRRSQKGLIQLNKPYFWPYSEDRIGVEVFKIGAIWIKSEKFGWSSCHMHIFACPQNRALFEPDDNWGWKYGKWITYNNIVRKRAYCEPGKPSPSTSKPNLTLNKRMLLCIWWDIRGPIHYELLKPNEKLNSEKYCQQLDNLKTAVQKKRLAMFNKKNIILHHDNARPHAALGIRQKIAEVGWEILSHPPYSPDIAPSDYHLFLSLQNFDGQKIQKWRRCQTSTGSIFRIQIVLTLTRDH